MEKEYWKNRYANQNTRWDINDYSPPLIRYIDSINNHEARILIPGNGMSHDAMYAYKKGFKNIYVCDWVEQARDEFFNRFPSFPKEQFILADFFEINDSFDYVLEQTFFCALAPSNRINYLKKVKDLLSEGGIFAGVLFNQPFQDDGPPFGGTKEQYRPLLNTYFDIQKIEECYNSIKPRQGRELFFICRNIKS